MVSNRHQPGGNPLMPSLIRGRQTAVLALATAALGGSVLAGCTAPPAGGTPPPSTTTTPGTPAGNGSGQAGACASVGGIAAPGTTRPPSGRFILGGPRQRNAPGTRRRRLP